MVTAATGFPSTSITAIPWTTDAQCEEARVLKPIFPQRSRAYAHTSFGSAVVRTWLASDFSSSASMVAPAWDRNRATSGGISCQSSKPSMLSGFALLRESWSVCVCVAKGTRGAEGGQRPSIAKTKTAWNKARRRDSQARTHVSTYYLAETWVLGVEVQQ